MDKSLLHASIERFSSFTFSRSGGKGGQNVNKVNTKAHLFIPVALLEGLTAAELAQMRKHLSSRINAENMLFVAVQDERTQEQNREIALVRLESLIIKASKILPKRKKTKPSAASKEKRLLKKKLRSAVKQTRGKTFLAD